MAEILVVVGILALLATITVYAIAKARKGADKQRLGFQLQIISAGLEAYQTDFGSFPVTTQLDPNIPFSPTNVGYYIDREGTRGARLLCKALMGQCGSANTGSATITTTPGNNFVLTKAHQDGKAGLGFAVTGRSGIAVYADNVGNLKGKTYGPYIAADKFQIANTNDAGQTLDPTTQKPIDSLNTAEKYDDTAVLLDGNGNPILYWPCLNPQAPLAVQYAYISRGRTPTTPGATVTSPIDPVEPGTLFTGTPMYASLDNSAYLAAPIFRKLLGDLGDNNVASTKADGKITGTELPAVRGKYILWSAGPDGIFGPQTKNGTLTPEDAMKRPDLYDDVTNFQGQ